MGARRFIVARTEHLIACDAGLAPGKASGVSVSVDVGRRSYQEYICVYTITI